MESFLLKGAVLGQPVTVTVICAPPAATTELTVVLTLYVVSLLNRGLNPSHHAAV